jgi:5-methylcytosine-specific restriction endonuclease McrA
MTTNGEDWEDIEPAEHEADESYITPETRRTVLLRDKWKCRKCGEEDLSALTLHHVKYRSHGGGHDADNLVTVCWVCHRAIHDKLVRVARVMGRWFFSDKRAWRNKQRRRHRW